jgi:hypothetical protein
MAERLADAWCLFAKVTMHYALCVFRRDLPLGVGFWEGSLHSNFRFPALEFPCSFVSFGRPVDAFALIGSPLVSERA